MKGKSIIAWFVGIIVLAGIIVGTVFGIKACKENKAGDGLAKYSTVEYFEDVQVEDTLAVIRAYAVGENFTAITYQIDNEDEVKVNGAITDEADEDWSEYTSDYKDLRYIDTRVITIDLSELEAGDHILKIFVYDGEEKEQIFKATFELKAATAA